MQQTYEVVVIGGGAAGLSGALMLARSRRSVLVIDAGEQRNLPAEGIHGLLTLDGTSPSEFLQRARAEVEGYGVEVLHATVVGVVRGQGGFTVSLGGGEDVHASALLVATGLMDQLPDVPGVHEFWGKSVLHCPYCHGWEVQDRAIGVLGGGPRSMHQALLFHQLSSDIVFFTNDAPLSTQDQDQLDAMGIKVVDGIVEQLEGNDGRLVGVRVSGLGVVQRDALVVGPYMRARTDFLSGLDLPIERMEGIGEFVKADPTGQTPVKGVWVAGNVSDLSAQVGASAAAGALAGARINAEFVEDEARAALVRHQRRERR